ncbi:hypothetical protein GCM10007884_48790 [Methylobacterium brachythecii]|uniref:Transposase n=1 Tax=Methylobacterium brachythecii TaxID=1176177 RepID=A0ABQ6D9L8_9HYPH|nr:hypothetical protein GCM10007884_48790 [Methylobacterium brachythecii]
MLGIPIYNHRNLETVLRSFNAACNGHRQRDLKALSLKMVLRQRLEADPTLINPRNRAHGPKTLQKDPHIVANANEVSQPDS